MRINLAVEPLVREAFGAAVGQDIDRSISALKAIADQGDQASQDSLNLASTIATLALLDIHDGERPDDEQLHELAKSFVEMEDWASFDEATAFSVLSALADQKSAQGLSPEAVSRIIFVLGAWLLAAFGPEERSWYQYLDQILNTIQSAQ